ncbi:hypothetical protein O6H91_03G021400 [Diphasiastrum complanatum]|uniref:Uncharacterized protein n=2 Tax=Diphasiastrum complanatum TaxID=34168 RepID=A0ACC2E4G6_DIPCM|nr:hypothetical protein O6H91_03G021400 [Diphasiastrum complanatum]
MGNTAGKKVAGQNCKEGKEPKAKLGCLPPACHNHNKIPLGRRTNFGYSREFKKKYKVGKLLGHGQFGYTYAADEVASGEKVAVKVIEKKQMLLPISIEDVRREVNILKLLSGHENVVHFHEEFEDDHYVYIVMELCEGGELLERILARKHRTYSEKDASKIIRQMLNVVARCHLNGVVHRDLKLENFLFKSQDDDSPIKAADFGLSDFIRPGKKFEDIVGSTHYLAPEVLKRKSGPESDVWSIGVISYIMLCGNRPFWDATEAGIFKQILKKRPDFREPAWSSVSSSAKDFVKKLLAKRPCSRLTASQALSHPWLRENDASSIPLDISVLSNMREFVKYNRAKQLAFRAFALTLESEEKSDLRDQFDTINEEKSGSITVEEIKEALAKDQPWAVPETRVVEIVQAMDINRDGLVDFDDFAAATVHLDQLEHIDCERWQQVSCAAFSRYDLDKNGYITVEELKQYAATKEHLQRLLDEAYRKGNKDPLQSLLADADTDGDGRISLDEFRKLLHRPCAAIQCNPGN